MVGQREEFSHEATSLGCQDECQNCLRGVVGTFGVRDLRRLSDQPGLVLSMAALVIGRGHRAFENGGAAGEVTRLMKLTRTRHWDTGRRIRPNRDTNSVKIIS